MYEILTISEKDIVKNGRTKIGEIKNRGY